MVGVRSQAPPPQVVVASALALVVAVAIASRVTSAGAAAGPPREVGPPLDRAERLEIARRHAPELRFNAWFPTDDPSPANRTEDFYPASVERFLKATDALVVVRRSDGPRPALVQRVALAAPPAYRQGTLEGYPPRMLGDPPGEAPIYADVYADPDDAGRVYAEFWSFYAMDQGDARAPLGIEEEGGHRSDWEHVALRLRRPRGGGTETSIESAVYYGHEHALFVSREALEVVEGTHPVVYVSQGKHASYPEPGEWRDYLGLAPAVRFDDVFHGNGVRIATWRGEVVDISRARAVRPRWLDWAGRWGPDDDRFLGISYARSSPGPWFHRESNDRFARLTGAWSAAKALAAGRLRCDRDLKLEAPRVEPPAPVRVD
jgi:hypothetical protein